MRHLRFQLLVIIAMVFFTLFRSAAYDFMIDGICYKKDNNYKNCVSVTYQNSTSPSYTSLSGALSIPSKVTRGSETYTVFAIGGGAFKDCTGLTSVTIPNSVTSIGGEAFSGCTGLTNVNIPNSVSDIENNAFRGCSNIRRVSFEDSNRECQTWTNYNNNTFTTPFSDCPMDTLYLGRNVKYGYCDENSYYGHGGSSPFCDKVELKSLTIGNLVTTIGNNAFSNCVNLTNVIIPNSVTTITRGAFSGCIGLTSVVIPPTISNIGPFAFCGCSSLSNVNLPDSITLISAELFKDCSNLTSVSIPNSVSTIGFSAFSGCSGLCSVTIPNAVTVIGEKAFYSCTNLTGVTIPNFVTTIGEGAFSRCSALTNVTIPSSVTLIEDFAFSGCSGLMSISVDSKNAVYDSRENCNAIIRKDSNTLIFGCKSTIIPNTVTSIYEGAFSGCIGLTSVTIPNSVTLIGQRAFQGTGLTSIKIPNSITSINYEVFSYCDSLKSVTIPNSVTNIEDDSFYFCQNLSTLIFEDGDKTCRLDYYNGHYSFSGCPLNYLYLGRNLVYENTYYISPFRGRTALKTVALGQSVTSINESMFKGCVNIETLNIDNNNFASISSFNDSRTKLKVLLLGNSVTSIGNGAFSGCTGLTSITIPNSVTSIGDNAFTNCTSLASITIPQSISSIGNGAFSGCTGLTGVTIPNSVTSIGGGAFSGCTGLTNVIWNAKNCVAVSDSTSAPFYNDASIIDFTFGNEVKQIPGWICYGLTGLTSVNISNSVTIIDKWAFFGCTGLTSITIPNSVTVIRSNAFSNCSGLINVTISKSLTALGKDVFSGCNKINRFKLLATTPPTLSGELGVAEIEVPLNCIYKYSVSNNWNNITKIYSMSNGIAYCLVTLNQDGETAVTLNGESQSLEIPEKSTVKVVPTSAFQGNTCLVTVNSINITGLLKSLNQYSFQVSKFHKQNVVSVYSSIDAITLSSPGTLAEILGRERMLSMTTLRVKGQLNGTDILAIRKMTKLQLLDMSEATIVNGGQSYYQDYVTSANTIGDYFFKDITNLTLVILPKTAIAIKPYAFDGMTNLKSIAIPSRITKIYADAFKGCSQLCSLVLEDGAGELDLCDSFTDCPLSYLYLGRNLTSSTSSVFRNKVTLKLLTVGLGATHVASNAFKGCTNLEAVIWNPQTSADYGTAYSSPFYNLISIKSFDFGDQVSKIPAYLCANLSSLTEVTIPKSIKEIGAGAFLDCTSLARVNVSSITSWCQISFANSSSNPLSMAHHLYRDGHEVTELDLSYTPIVGNFAFYSATELKSVLIGNSVTSIGHGAFIGCKKLVTLTIGNSVTSIGGWAFSNCVGLTTVAIPNSVTSIGEGIFAYDNGLNSVVLSNSISNIPKYAFQRCVSLSSIRIPDSVKSIGDDAFVECDGLTRVDINSLSLWCKIAFATIASNPLSLAHSLYVNNNELTSLVVPNDVSSLLDYVFYGCSGLKSVKMPYSVTSIGIMAFVDCEALANVTLSDALTSIGNYAFKGCEQMKRVDINSLSHWCKIVFSNFLSNPLSLAKHLYVNKNLLTSLVVPDDISSLLNYAFYGCSDLKSVTVPNSVSAVGNYVFYGCNELAKVTWNVKSCADWSNAGSSPFYNNASIKSFIIGEEVVAIPKYLCYGLSGLTSMTIYNKVATIGSDAFTGCNSIYTLNIDNNNFANISYFPSSNQSLRVLKLGNSVKTLAQSAFSGCNLSLVSIGENVTAIGENAFSGSTLSTVYSYNPTPPEIKESTFTSSTYANATLYTPKGRSTIYWLHPYWENFVNIEEMTDGGDINDDEAVDVGDVNAVLGAILANDNGSKYDVNRDGNVDVGDVNAILEKILEQKARRRALGLE